MSFTYILNVKVVSVIVSSSTFSFNPNISINVFNINAPTSTMRAMGPVAWHTVSVGHISKTELTIGSVVTRKHPQGKVARRAFCVGSAHTNFALRSTIHSTNIRPQIMCLGSNMPDWRKKHGWLQMMSRWSVWSLCHASILKKLGTYTKRKTPKPVSRLRSERDGQTDTQTHTEHHPNLSSPTQKALRAIIYFEKV